MGTMTKRVGREAPFAERYRDGFIRANGLRLHYTEWNENAGDHPLLLVHGANVQLHTWDPIASALSATHRVVCLDLRGHGDSQWAKDGYRVHSFVADIRKFTEALDMPLFSYVGHSLGARVGLAYSGTYPDTVKHLILSDTGPEVASEGAKFAQKIVGTAGEVRGFTTREEALAHFERLHAEWKPIFHELHVRWQLRENWAGKLVFKSDPDLFWMTGSAGARETPQLWELTGRIEAPTLILWGKRSGFLNDEIVRRMLSLIPRAEVVRTDTAHYIPREDPDEFIRLVREFVSR